MYQHINQNNILATKQYGFRNNSLTEKTSFKLINEIQGVSQKSWNIYLLKRFIDNTRTNC
jgi:hypothetical protein